MKKDAALVCGLPCAYRVGSLLPWPPQLPGIDNWATGDVPTITAYLHALGERVFELEVALGKSETRVRELEARTVGLIKF